MEQLMVEPIEGISLTKRAGRAGSAYVAFQILGMCDCAQVTLHLNREELSDIVEACETALGWLDWHGARWALVEDEREWGTKYHLALTAEPGDKALCGRRIGQMEKTPLHGDPAEHEVHEHLCKMCLKLYRQQMRIEELENVIAHGGAKSQVEEKPS